jgi:hypothetical protein
VLLGNASRLRACREIDADFKALGILVEKTALMDGARDEGK